MFAEMIQMKLAKTGRALANFIFSKHSLQGGILQNRSKALGAFDRHFHHATEKNVVVSSYPEIVIPICTFAEYVWADLDKWPDKTSVVCGITGRGYTYAQTYKMSIAFAACLRNKLKLQDGDCVAVMLPNCPEFPLATLGSIHAGCIVTTVNPIYTAEEVSTQLLSSKAKVVITAPECYNVVKKATELSKQLIHIILTESTDGVPPGAIKFAEFAENFSEDAECLRSVRRTADDTLFLPYSSGTTGLPKGVELMNRNIVATCLQQAEQKLSVILPTTNTHQDVTVCVLPFFHIYGLTVSLLSKMSLGLKIVTLPKFNPETYLNAQAKYKGTLLFVVPPIVLFLSSHPSVNHTHLESIKLIMSGAAPLAASDVDRFLKKTGSGVAIMQGYGLTETSPTICMQESGSQNFASVGSLVANTEAKIVDMDDHDKVLRSNEVGELWVRGPQVMKGYHNNPAANEETFRPGGWMRTGDLGYYDEEFAFYITDRLKELIKVKGYQVAPAELEGILRTHPDISEAAVIGVPHPSHGETPKAFVIKKPGTSPSADSIKEFVANKVASYKKLGDVVFVNDIPKSAAGKILRRKVKAMFA